MFVASCAIFLNFFEEQSTQNHPQYLSGLSRALFPTTFLEIAVEGLIQGGAYCSAFYGISLALEFCVNK